MTPSLRLIGSDGFLAWEPMKITAAVAAALALSGCATLMNGTTQAINVQTTPPGGICTLNGRATTAPGFFIVKRSDWQASMKISCTREGYLPATFDLKNNTSAWIWGNLPLVNLPGLIIDANTQAAAYLTPDIVKIELKKAP